MSSTVDDRRIDGPHGPIPVRVHTPGGRAGAGLVWAHGGAFFGGDLDMPESDRVARQLAGRGIAVVTVDYRLAPILDWTTGERAPVQPGERFHPQEIVSAVAASPPQCRLRIGPA